MSLISAISPSDPYRRKNWTSEGGGGLLQQLSKVGEFVRALRVQLRFGELTRAPLRLLRFEIVDNGVECDWLARPADAWDASLSRSIQRRHASLQALRDAIDVRNLLFDVMPHVENASFRVYREGTHHKREMIIAGSSQRNDQSSRDLHSLVMHAKVLGFRFDLEGDSLRALPSRS